MFGFRIRHKFIANIQQICLGIVVHNNQNMQREYIFMLSIAHTTDVKK